MPAPGSMRVLLDVDDDDDDGNGGGKSRDSGGRLDPLDRRELMVMRRADEKSSKKYSEGEGRMFRCKRIEECARSGKWKGDHDT